MSHPDRLNAGVVGFDKYNVYLNGSLVVDVIDAKAGATGFVTVILKDLAGRALRRPDGQVMTQLRWGRVEFREAKLDKL